MKILAQLIHKRNPRHDHLIWHNWTNQNIVLFAQSKKPKYCFICAIEKIKILFLLSEVLKTEVFKTIPKRSLAGSFVKSKKEFLLITNSKKEGTIKQCHFKGKAHTHTKNKAPIWVFLEN